MVWNNIFPCHEINSQQLPDEDWLDVLIYNLNQHIQHQYHIMISQDAPIQILRFFTQWGLVCDPGQNVL